MSSSKCVSYNPDAVGAHFKYNELCERLGRVRQASGNTSTTSQNAQEIILTPVKPNIIFKLFTANKKKQSKSIQPSHHCNKSQQYYTKCKNTIACNEQATIDNLRKRITMMAPKISMNALNSIYGKPCEDRKSVRKRARNR